MTKFLAHEKISPMSLGCWHKNPCNQRFKLLPLPAATNHSDKRNAHARKKERERERERDRERERKKAEEERKKKRGEKQPTRGERGDRTQEKRSDSACSTDLPRSTRSCPARQAKARKETRAGHQEKQGERERQREKERERERESERRKRRNPRRPTASAKRVGPKTTQQPRGKTATKKNNQKRAHSWKLKVL